MSSPSPPFVLSSLSALRGAVGGIGVALLLALGAGCSAPTAVGAVSACDVSTLNLTQPVSITPSLTEGPYFVDDRVATDMRGDRSGVPLTLTFTVYNITDDSCARISGAWVDMWHADGLGKYSDIASEGTSGQQWLRGYAVSNAQGAVTFASIYPGWYNGRTVHIHTKLRLLDSSSAVVYNLNTQYFFDEAVTDAVYAGAAPYNTRGARSTRNANDGIFTSADNVPLQLTGSVADGYTASVPILYPINLRATGTGGGGSASGSASGSGSGSTDTAGSSAAQQTSSASSSAAAAAGAGDSGAASTRSALPAAALVAAALASAAAAAQW